MAKYHEWTPAEIKLLKTMDGVHYKDVAEFFPGRSVRSISTMRTRLKKGMRLDETKPRSMKGIAKDTPPAPSGLVRASERLRVATLKAIINYANDNGLGVDQAASRLLSEAR